VVWITDPNSASGFGGPNQTGVLRNMSEAGRSNTLAAYVTLGGLVWLAGGGAVDATMFPWNLANNDRTQPLGVRKYSNLVQSGRIELTAGRMVFDLAYWQSEIWVSNFDLSVGLPHKSIRAVGGWPSRVDGRTGTLIRSPDYSLLPSRLSRKSIADDPVPPFRSAGSYYTNTGIATCEVLVGDMAQLEDANPDPDTTNMVSTMDTLLIMSGYPLLNFANGPQVLENEDLSNGGQRYHSNPVMTYYHGFLSAPFVLSGHDLWNYSKRDIVKLVDFVFQQIWGIQKDPIVTPAATTAAARTRSRS